MNKRITNARRTRCLAGKRSGFTLIEVILASSVLAIAVVLTSSSVLTSMKVVDSNRERTLAVSGAQAALEVLAGADFAQVFALYNDDPTDDPAGAGTAPGSHFAVDGLEAQSGDADGLPGEVSFPTLAGAPGALREDAGSELFGGPSDLDCDGTIDSDDHSTDYVVLPVQVRVLWAGSTGNHRVQLTTMLAGE